MVQSYSLRQHVLLEPTHVHPSPPTVFSLSSTAELLISCSVRPPVIQLSNRSTKEPSILLTPDASSAAVVAATFHPGTSNTFLLAFADGTLSIYDALHFLRSRSQGRRMLSGAGIGKGGEIGHMKKLHTTANTGDLKAGITAAVFVPGSTCTTASVGADGKCCIVEFNYDDRGSNKVMATWHVRGGATSLSILPHKRYQDQKVTVSDFLVAIGRQDCFVRLYDLEGGLKWHRSFDITNTSRILDVEWIKGSGLLERRNDIATFDPNTSIGNFQQTPPFSSHQRSQYRQSYPYSLAGHGDNQSSEEQVPSRAQSLRRNTERRQSNSSAKRLSSPYFNPENHEPKAKTPDSNTEVRGGPANSGIRTHCPHTKPNSTDVPSSSSSRVASPENLPRVSHVVSVRPHIPPRPVGREGGQYAIRRAERTAIGTVATEDVRVLDITNPHSKPSRPMAEGHSNQLIRTTHAELIAGQSSCVDQHPNVSPESPWTWTENSSATPKSPVGTRVPGSSQSAVLSSASPQTMRFNSLFLPPSSYDSDTVIDWVASSKYTPHPTIRKESRSDPIVNSKSSSLLQKASKLALKRLPSKLANAAITQRLMMESQPNLAPETTFSTFQNMLQEEMETFKRDVRAEIRAQSDWFKREVKGIEDAKLKLIGENRRLRDELARLSKGGRRRY